MRRLACLLALALLPAALTGCAGADAKRAESLLQQASVAQRAVMSEQFVVRMTFGADGHSGGLAMQGGAQLKGTNAGDFYLTAVPTGELDSSAMNFTVVRRGTVVTAREGATTRTLSLPQAQSQFGANLNQVTHLLDIARYVKSVSVDGSDLNGRPADRIVGTIDTGRMLSLGSLGDRLLGGAGLGFGDIHVTLFIPHDTHLVEMLFADMDMKVAAHTAHLHLSVTINHVNDPLTFPSL
jgi:RNase P/RNase MRP subunit p29